MKEITEKTFNDNLVLFHKTNKIPFLIMFYSDTCSYCNVIEFYINKIKNIISNKEILFYKININNEKITEKYNIKATPTILIFNQNRKLEEIIIGINKLELLKEKILIYKKETFIERVIKYIKKEEK